jgi:DNA processing protein
MREKLIALSIVKKGNWDEVYRFLRDNRNLDSIDEFATCELIQQLDCDALTLLDNEYPSAWHEMPKPPFVVFYKGDIGLLNAKSISVIGGKEVSNHTSKVVRHVMGALPDDVSVISGFEIGVEAYSMSLASQRIAVIASGFGVDRPYQKYKSFKNMNKCDLILSELPPNVKFDMSAYYRSYHLIHELSDMVCVFELPSFDLRLKYLAYLTDIGKDVVVTPDVLKKSTSGGLGIVNRGAKLLLRSKDIFKIFD